MLFCPHCGLIMVFSRREGDVAVFKCPACGYERRIPWSEAEKLQRGGAGVPVKRTEHIIVEAKPQGAVVTVICPRCGHNKAYVQIMQTRAADEPPTRIYRCAKCGYTWREYS